VTAILEASKSEEKVWTFLWNIVHYRSIRTVGKTKKYMSSNTIPHLQKPTEYSYSNHELKVQTQWLINGLWNPKAPRQTQCTFVKNGPLLHWNCSEQGSMYFYVVTKILLLPTNFK
jgi:hypothetical protein